MAETVTTIDELKLRRLTKTVLDNKQTVNANELLLVDPEFTGGKMLSTDNTGDMIESNIASADVSDAIDKKHSHSNKSTLDLIPSSLGTAGQAIVVNSGATGLEFATVGGGGGSSTLAGLTDTNISSPSDGQMLKYDNSSSKWINANVPTELPTITGNASKVLAVNSGATGVEWVTPSSGLTNHDFTHIPNATVSSASTTITFAANQRGSQMISVSADIDITFDVRNLSDNYLWINNTGSSEIDVTISSVVNDQTAVSNVYVPADGISVPASGLCEIGIVRNADGAFITSRNDLEL